MKKWHQLLFIPLFSCILLLAGCNYKYHKHKYEIEDVYSNDSFNSIIEGELVPVEIKFGIVMIMMVF